MPDVHIPSYKTHDESDDWVGYSQIGCFPQHVQEAIQYMTRRDEQIYWITRHTDGTHTIHFGIPAEVTL